MSLEDITLPTNKSETRVSNNRRTIRSGEKGLAIKVTLVDANDQPYDLSAFTLEFNEIKDQGKIVLDDGSGDASGQFEKLDAKGGVFSYTLAPQVYSASGKCWFVLKKGDAIIDTTKDFYFDVEQEASIHIDNDNYVSSLQTEIDHFKATTQRVDEDWSSLKNTMDTGYQSRVNDFDKLKSDWQTQTAKIDSDAKAQLDKINADASAIAKAIQGKADKQYFDNQARADTQNTDNQTKADAQLKSQNDKFNSTLDDQVKQIQTKRDAAIADVNKKFNDDMANWTSQYNEWLTDTKNSYNTDIASLKQTLKMVQDGINDVDTKKFPDMMAKVNEVEDKIKKAQANFDSIDFSSYAKKADVYTKTEVDKMIASAGKLKTISVNGGTPMNPDSKGNVNVAIPKVDLSQINEAFKNLTPDFNSPELPSGFDLNSYWVGWRRIHHGNLKNVPSSSWNNNSMFFQGEALNNDGKFQIGIHLGDSDSDNPIIAYRVYGWGKWKRWQTVANKSDLDTLRNSLGNDYYKKADVDKKFATKADKTDVTSVSNQLQAVSITANDNKLAIANLKKNGVGFKPITQAEYDALSESEKANGMYAIGDSN